MPAEEDDAGDHADKDQVELVHQKYLHLGDGDVRWAGGSLEPLEGVAVPHVRVRAFLRVLLVVVEGVDRAFGVGDRFPNDRVEVLEGGALGVVDPVDLMGGGLAGLFDRGERHSDRGCEDQVADHRQPTSVQPGVHHGWNPTRATTQKQTST
jgi:hypothetical protein